MVRMWPCPIRSNAPARSASSTVAKRKLARAPAECWSSPIQQRALTQLNDARDRPPRLGAVTETVPLRSSGMGRADRSFVAIAMAHRERARPAKRLPRSLGARSNRLARF